MAATELAGDSTDHAGRMDQMYRYQRHIYDLTRKYYLFGRDGLVRGLDVPLGGSVLEIGCGTGRNLVLIRRHYPSARLFGLDISAEMLASAKSKLARNGAAPAGLRVADATSFDAAEFGETGFDRIVISYALSMIPEWEKAIDAAVAALAPSGSLHIVDFGQQERLPGFVANLLRAWLARFHVTPRARLREAVEAATSGIDGSLAFHGLGRGYAWRVIFRRSQKVMA